MMKTLTKQILFTSLLIGSSQAFASGPSLDQNTMNTLNGDTAQNQKNYNLAPTNTTSGAKDGSGAADISKIVSIGVAGYTGYICVASHGTNFMACVMAAQSLAQIGKSGAGSSDAGNYGGQYTPYDPNAASNSAPPPYDPNNLNDPNNPLSPNYIKPNGTNTAGDGSITNSNDPYKGMSANEKSQLQKLKSDLNSAGVSIDDKAGTMRLADGKVVPLSSTPGSLKAAGFDGAQIDKTVSDVQAYGSNLAAKTTAAGGGVPALTFGGMGGGGGSHSAGVGAGGGNSNFDPNSMLGGRKPSGIEKQGVAGLSRKLGDESIGVKGDNIFEMVNRRYRAQDKQNAFLRDK